MLTRWVSFLGARILLHPFHFAGLPLHLQGFNCFFKVNLSSALCHEARENFIKEQIRKVEIAIREQSGHKGTRMVKELERMKKRLEAKLEGLSAEEKKDTSWAFAPTAS